MMRRFTWKRLLLVVVILLVLGMVGFVVWAETPPAPMDEAQTALQSDAQVEVSTTQWIVFKPTDKEPTTGLIFYPGGRVDDRSYAPQLHAIAEQGYLTVIVPMPLNLAIFGVNQANDVIKAFPQIKHWAIAGHSLGGSMAARFVQSNPTAVEGLVFWASYPDIDLSSLPVAVTSISGTKDGLSTPDKITSTAHFLPADTTFVVIDGGDHAQFGWYGPQAGDNPADISRDDQQIKTVQATVDLLAKLDSAAPAGR
ncbi:MAG: alpha/beta hydrolase [Chloroflexota bacterium]